MFIKHLYVDGFKRLLDFHLPLTATINVLVGDNETGKSTVLEAAHLVLTRQYDRRAVDYSLDPYLFNADRVATYFHTLRSGATAPPPRIVIEAYLDSENTDPDLARLKGTHNTQGENAPGLCLSIEVDSDHLEAMREYAADDSNPQVLPTEFYKIAWTSFSGEAITLRKLPFRATTIDTTLPRVHRGPNKYVAQVMGDVLTDEQRRNLSLAYKKLQHVFGQQDEVAAINEHLEQQELGSGKMLSVQMDMTARATWDSAITAHLNDLPFDCAGKGEQCRIQMRLAVADAAHARVILIEEPESHLSHSNLNALMEEISRHCAGQQVVVTTHSAFVLNKLGIDALRLLSPGGQVGRLADLPTSTQKYFMRLPGFDTLRLVLARRSILVEGPSDELVVQRAYRDQYGKLPLEDGVDVIAVGSLSFKRFLDIARLLKCDVRVITDNDGDVDSLKRKYEDFDGLEHIQICYDDDENCRTLEPQLLKANSLHALNDVLGTQHEDAESLLKYMKGRKTDCALRLFETENSWEMPRYIRNAIAR